MYLFLCFSGVSVNVQDLTPSCAGALYGTSKLLFSYYHFFKCICQIFWFSLTGFMNMMGAFMGA